MKSSFAPLRPRADTNTARGPGDRLVVVRGADSVPVIQPLETSEIVTPLGNLGLAGQPVPAATTSGRGESQSGSSLLGRVMLRGTPPPEKPITLDAVCGRLHPAPMTTRHFVVSEDAGLANVFVYVKSGAGPKKRPQPSAPLLDNVNCVFQPYVLGVRAGQPFQIRNSDPVLHNMHSLPKNSGNREFNLGFPVSGMTQLKIFDKPEVFIQMKCDVHPWMFAYIAVVDHPWFAITDSNGNFAFPTGLPDGEYTIAAVHLKAGEASQQIRIQDNTAAPITFTLEVPKTLAKTNTP